MPEPNKIKETNESSVEAVQRDSTGSEKLPTVSEDNQGDELVSRTAN